MRKKRAEQYWPSPEGEGASFSWKLQGNNEHKVGGHSPLYFWRVRKTLFVYDVNKWLGTYRQGKPSVRWGLFGGGSFGWGWLAGFWFFMALATVAAICLAPAALG